jgi:hypothetical protein
LKGLADSLNLNSFVKLAINQGLKSIDLQQLNNGLAQSQQELKKVLAEGNVKVAMSGDKLRDIVLKSLNAAKNSIYKVSVNGSDDDSDVSGNTDDEGDGPVLTANSNGNTASISAGRVVTITGHSAARQSVKARQRAVQAHRADSLRSRAYSYINGILRKGATANAYSNTTPEPQAFTNLVAMPASYSGNDSDNYVPVKFNQNVPFKLSLGKATDDVSVTAKENTTLIAVKEDDEADDSYKKHITIETLDNSGQRHIYHITVEMYQ